MWIKLPCYWRISPPGRRMPAVRCGLAKNRVGAMAPRIAIERRQSAGASDALSIVGNWIPSRATSINSSVRRATLKIRNSLGT